MLLIPDFIIKKELSKIKKYFSKEDLIILAKKVSDGLGIGLKKSQKGNIVKLKTTINGVSGRTIFFLITKLRDVFPVVIRLKKDKIGDNMSFKNKTFKKVFNKNLELIENDFKNNNFEVIEI